MKLTTEGVYQLVEKLLPQYQRCLGLTHWRVGIERDSHLPLESAARTEWDIGNHIAVVMVNTIDFKWSDTREPDCLVLQQTLAHELAHLWFGEAGLYKLMSCLVKAGVLTEGAHQAVDGVIEEVVDMIASCLVYRGILKEFNVGDTTASRE